MVVAGGGGGLGGGLWAVLVLVVLILAFLLIPSSVLDRSGCAALHHLRSKCFAVIEFRIEDPIETSRDLADVLRCGRCNALRVAFYVFSNSESERILF